MKITRKINISVITEKKVLVSSPTVDNETIYCEQCAAEMIPAHISADFFGFSSRVIYRLIEADKVHFLETERNEIYVCPVSVAEVLQKTLRECF